LPVARRLHDGCSQRVILLQRLPAGQHSLLIRQGGAKGDANIPTTVERGEILESRRMQLGRHLHGFHTRMMKDAEERSPNL
jgi:hypothetical protein